MSTSAGLDKNSLSAVEEVLACHPFQVIANSYLEKVEESRYSDLGVPFGSWMGFPDCYSVHPVLIVCLDAAEIYLFRHRD
jgi:hypothetical protein